jgi:hypothetical protein
MAVAETTLREGDAAGADLRRRPIFGVTLVEHEPNASRETRWVQASARELDRAWPSDRADRTVDLRFPDGKLFMAVEHDTQSGYMVRAPRFGRHIVSSDGRTITSALPRIAPWRWERLFLAQALPLAAALHGLEVFHASAVALGDHVVAFVGTSGVGKTSTAAHLVARGAEFVTDDVLALELTDAGVLAHPGPPRLSIDAAEVRRMPTEGREQLGLLLGTFEKRQFAPRPIEGAQRLGAVYFLERAPSGPAIVEIDEPRRLLGASFIPHLQSPTRLMMHLDICASVALHARTFAIEIPPGCHADEVAALVHEHAESLSS